MKALFLLAAGVQLAVAAPAPQLSGLGIGFPPGLGPKGAPKSTARRTTQPAPPKPTSSLPVGLTLSTTSAPPKSTATSATTVPKEFTPPPPSGPPCRNIPGDPGWPADNVWKSELPGVIAVAQKTDAKHPNYHYSARNHGDVQAAVNFAVRHHVRLSVIASGHVSFADKEFDRLNILTSYL
jgi:hypothetical protein